MKFKKFTSYEEYCKLTGDDPTLLPAPETMVSRHAKAAIALLKLSVINEGVNMDEKGNRFEVDWSNARQYKYNMWVGIKADKEHPAGVGFSDPDVDYWTASTSCGVRLCYRDEARAEYVFETFNDLFKDLFLMT